MVKAKFGNTLFIGLSHANLDKLKAGQPIKLFNLKEVGFDVDINIAVFSEKDEQAMYEAFKKEGKLHPTKTIFKSDNQDKN